jgi:hypothetical protein
MPYAGTREEAEVALRSLWTHERQVEPTDQLIGRRLDMTRQATRGGGAVREGVYEAGEPGDRRSAATDAAADIAVGCARVQAVSRRFRYQRFGKA